MVGPSSPRSQTMPSGTGCGPGLAATASSSTTTGRRRTSTRIVGRGSHHSPTPGAPTRGVHGSKAGAEASSRQTCHDADLLEYLRRQRLGPPLLSRRVLPFPAAQPRASGVAASSSAQAPRHPQNPGSGAPSGSGSAAASPRSQAVSKTMGATGSAVAAPPAVAPATAPVTVFPAPATKGTSSMVTPGESAAEIAAVAAEIAAERVDSTKAPASAIPSGGTHTGSPRTHASDRDGSWLQSANSSPEKLPGSDGVAMPQSSAPEEVADEAVIESESGPRHYPMAPAPTARSQALLSPTSQGGGMSGSRTMPDTRSHGESKTNVVSDGSPLSTSARSFQQQALEPVPPCSDAAVEKAGAVGGGNLDGGRSSGSGGGSGCVPGFAAPTSSATGRRRGTNRAVARSPHHSPAPGAPARVTATATAAAVPKANATEAAAGRQTCHSAKIQRRQWLGPPVLSSRRITPSSGGQVRSLGGSQASQNARHSLTSGTAATGGNHTAALSPRSQAARAALAAPPGTAFSTPPSKETVAVATSATTMVSPASSPSTGGGNAAAEIAAAAAAIAAERADSTKRTSARHASSEGMHLSPCVQGAGEPCRSEQAGLSPVPQQLENAPETSPTSPFTTAADSLGNGADVSIALEEPSFNTKAAGEKDSPNRFLVKVSVPDDTEDDDGDEIAACTAVSESVVGHLPMAPAPTARSQALLSPSNQGGSAASGPVSPSYSPQATPLGEKSRSLNVRSFLQNGDGPSDDNLHEHDRCEADANPRENGEVAVDGSPVASSVRTASPSQQLQQQHLGQTSRPAFGDIDADKVPSSHQPCDNTMDGSRLEGSGGGATGASTAATSGDEERCLASGLGGTVIWAGVANEASQRSGLAAAAAAAVASNHVEGSTAPAPASLLPKFSPAPEAVGGAQDPWARATAAAAAASAAAAAAGVDSAVEGNADIGAGVAAALGGVPDLSAAPNKVLLLSSLVDHLVKHAASCEKRLAAEQRANLSLRVSVWTLERQNSQLQQQLNSVSQSFQQLLGGTQVAVEGAQVSDGFALAAPVEVPEIQPAAA